MKEGEERVEPNNHLQRRLASTFHERTDNIYLFMYLFIAEL
jgi:DNA-binding XRE family transcriptional regulator